MQMGAQALCQDEFSKCFEPRTVERPPSLSLGYLVYMVGMSVRYGVLFPMRLGVLITGFIFFALLLPLALISQDGALGQRLFVTFCKVWVFALGMWVRHHGRKPALDEAHIFVANHTSFIDFFMMSSHRFCHATVAQVHGGLFGFLQRHALSLNGSLFFHRDETKDREKLARKMREHTQDRQTSPLVIFPEGTCVNNEYTVLFHKGAFELGCAVCPVAIRYNKRLGDPYWNTREQTFTDHVFYLMTRWMMVADVWWLEPRRIGAEESSIAFAERVKAAISEAAGLKNLSWNGYLKNFVRKQDQEKLRSTSQQEYGATLRRKLGAPEPAADADAPPPTPNLDIIKPTDSLIEARMALTLTDIRNEVLISSSPPTAGRARSGTSFSGAGSLLEKLSEKRSTLADDWRTLQDELSASTSADEPPLDLDDDVFGQA